MLSLSDFLLARVWEAESSIPAGAHSGRDRDECRVRRRLVALHCAVHELVGVGDAAVEWVWCATCGCLDHGPVDYPCRTLKVLAIPYADHPDFDGTWVLDEYGDS